MKMTSKLLTVAALALIGTVGAFADQQGTDIMQKAKDLEKPKFSHSLVEFFKFNVFHLF